MGMQALKKKKGLTTTTIVTVFLLIFMLSDAGADGRLIRSNQEGCCRPDVIMIDSIKKFGDLERLPVLFLHDRHTDALEKKDKDCQACHLFEKDRLSPKFKRLKDAGRQEVMDIYHAGCMGCHEEMVAEREKTGPLEICGECHRDKVKVISSRQPMGFDKSLHFRHSEAIKDKEANEEKCERCHHEYDEKTKKLFYAKGTEGTCRYCHMEKAEENRISMSLASHLFCIDCHRKMLAVTKAKVLDKNKIVGPIKCSGCHDFNKQQMIKKVKNVPRIKRKQPDVILIGTNREGTASRKLAGKMNPVPMDHKAHEKYNDTCRVCHHESLNSCSECHTLAGAKEGKNVKLERAMHQIGTTKSCRGCHELRHDEKRCAGCHTFMEKDRKQAALSCFGCHIKALQPDTEIAEQPEVVASKLLKSRKAVTDTYEDEYIPEKIIIKELGYDYEPVQFPHRKIVDSLIRNIKDSKLTSYFHSEKGAICQACHHNSPITKKPPRCISCHGKSFDETNLLRPGLKAAYHRQCMGCHKEMGIKKPESTECTDCHKAAGKSRLFD
jgi:hypothetical protein